MNLYSGNESGLFPARNLTQTKDGGLFGRSLEGCDVNNDGHDELIVGNTGTYSSPATYSSVEYYYGSSSGYNGTADHTLAQIVQGKLFGHNIACVGDLDGDGYDEHIISEPFNSTSGAFGAGALWLFEGTSGQLSGGADWQYWPPPNSRIGEAMAPAVTSTRTATTTFTSPVEWERRRTGRDFPRFSHRHQFRPAVAGRGKHQRTPRFPSWLPAAMSTGTG